MCCVGNVVSIRMEKGVALAELREASGEDGVER